MTFVCGGSGSHQRPRSATSRGTSCVLIAFSLPWEPVAAGTAVVALGAAVFGARRLAAARDR